MFVVIKRVCLKIAWISYGRRTVQCKINIKLEESNLFKLFLPTITIFCIKESSLFCCFSKNSYGKLRVQSLQTHEFRCYCLPTTMAKREYNNGNQSTYIMHETLAVWLNQTNYFLETSWGLSNRWAMIPYDKSSFGMLMLTFKPLLALTIMPLLR